jgi:hypothetical protein
LTSSVIASPSHHFKSIMMISQFWRNGSSTRVPALQAWSLEFKL